VPGLNTFSKTSRLLNPASYAAVFDGCSEKASNKIGTLLSVETTLPEARIGIIVAKRQIKRASQRNRVKRLVREDFRLRSFEQSADYVFLARHSCTGLSKKQFSYELDSLWRKLVASKRSLNTSQ
jgi:ribonuclease P protein component